MGSCTGCRGNGERASTTATPRTLPSTATSARTGTSAAPAGRCQARRTVLASASAATVPTTFATTMRPYAVVTSWDGASSRVSAAASPVSAITSTQMIATTPKRRARSGIPGERSTACVAIATTPPPHTAVASMCPNPATRARV